MTESPSFTIVALLEDARLSTRLLGYCERSNYRIEFPDSDNAVEHCSAIKQGLVLVEIDLRHPRLLQVGHEIKQKTGMPVIGVIEQFCRQVQQQADELGFDLVVPKPFFTQNLDALIQQIQKAE